MYNRGYTVRLPKSTDKSRQENTTESSLSHPSSNCRYLDIPKTDDIATKYQLQYWCKLTIATESSYQFINKECVSLFIQTQNDMNSP